MGAGLCAELAEELAEGVDEVWAETIRFLPMNDGLPDETRGHPEFQAVLRTGSKDEERVSFGKRSAPPPGFTGAGGTLRIDRGAHPDLLMRQDDKIVALDRAGEPVFLIALVDDRSHHRLIVELGDAN